MQRANLSDELLLGAANVEHRLAWLRIAKEHHEKNRVSRAKRDAGLRVVLETANAGTVSGTWIDDQIGTLLHVDIHACGRTKLQQRIVDRSLELATVEHDVILEMQHRRRITGTSFDELGSALV
jgi:hypothetical protein